MSVYLSFLLSALIVGAVPLVAARAEGEPLWKVILVTAFMPVASVGLYYSLAVHMFWSLGGWPKSIGQHGFPRALSAHADLAGGTFAVSVFCAVFFLPVAFLVCAVVPRLQPGLRYLGIYALACVAAIGAMAAAPEPFLDWWLD